MGGKKVWPLYFSRTYRFTAPGVRYIIQFWRYEYVKVENFATSGVRCGRHNVLRTLRHLNWRMNPIGMREDRRSSSWINDELEQQDITIAWSLTDLKGCWTARLILKKSASLNISKSQSKIANHQTGPKMNLNNKQDEQTVCKSSLEPSDL